MPYGDTFSLPEGQVFIPEIWSTDAIRYLVEDLVFARYVKMIPFQGKSGDLIRYPRISRLGVSIKAIKSPVEYQSITENEWQVRIQRYVSSAFRMDEVLEIQAHSNLRSIYTTEIGQALARDIDFRLMAERAAIIGADATSHIVSSSPLSEAEILAALEILAKRRVQINQCVFIFTPSHWASLLAINRFTSRDFVDGAPVTNGMVGRLFGVPVIFSNNITINSLTGLKNGDNDPTPGPTPGMTGSDYYPTQEDGTVTSLTANYYSGVLLHRDCIAMVTQKAPRIDSDWDIDYQQWKVVSTMLYDVKLYRPDHGVVISTDEDNLI
jgi:Phage capsid protein